jgi:hypothetical protein
MENREKRNTIFVKLLLLACMGGTLWAFSASTTPAQTGAFGESTCIQCHDSNSLNAAGGSFSIGNVPQNYTPGQTYPIQVTISRSGQLRWGFELAARAASNGQQAGTLTSTDRNTEVTVFNGIQYIRHTSAGTFFGAVQGTWTFDWTAPSSPAGQITFAAAGTAADGNFSNGGDFVYTTTATAAPAAPNPITLVFPQVAVGGGYSTIFNLVNTGDTILTGNLSLAQPDGSLMIVNFGSVQSASTPITIPPGGTQQVTAGPLDTTEPARAGWGRLESSGGTPGGVGIFQFVEGGVLKTIVGVLSSAPSNAVTIPIYDDASQSRYTGYAFANPGTTDVRIKIVLIDSTGIVVQTIRPPSLNPLTAGGYYSRFLNEDLNSPSFQFEGSIVAIADGTDTFSVMALVLDQGLLTATPVIPGKTAGVN